MYKSKKAARKALDAAFEAIRSGKDSEPSESQHLPTDEELQRLGASQESRDAMEILRKLEFTRYTIKDKPKIFWK